MKRLLLLSGTALLAACASNPVSPASLAGDKVEIFAVAPDAPNEWIARGVAGQAPTTDWLAQFGDPRMNTLVSEALANSPTLQQRAALVRASEAFLRVSRSGRLPTLSASVSGGVTSTGFGGVPDRITDGLYGLGIDGSWEIDLWNRIGSGIAESDAELLASEADLAAAELSVAARTAIAWINLNAALAQERVAVQTFEAR